MCLLVSGIGKTDSNLLVCSHPRSVWARVRLGRTSLRVPRPACVASGATAGRPRHSKRCRWPTAILNPEKKQIATTTRQPKHGARRPLPNRRARAEKKDTPTQSPLKSLAMPPNVGIHAGVRRQSTAGRYASAPSESRISAVRLGRFSGLGVSKFFVAPFGAFAHDKN
jgi:hypothetical protein